jgi:preprotein translocase subunit SecE
MSKKGIITPQLPLRGVLNYKKISTTGMGIITYFKETKAEMKHVTWPTWKETRVFTALIIVISLFIAALLGFFDWVFTRIVQFFV